MSTRAMYTFRNADGSEEFHVYKHSDGYPTGAAEALVAALDYAWPLPRYEADEFSAAFVAANKSYYISQELEIMRTLLDGRFTQDRSELVRRLAQVRDYASKGYGGGGIRLCASGPFDDIAPQDLEYHYIIQPKKGGNDMACQLLVTAYAVNHVGETRYVQAQAACGRYVLKPVPLKEQGWKRTKLFTAPLKSGGTLKAKAAAWEVKRKAA
jgi:hypothetical protein